MKNLLALLVSASIIHQTNHWNSKGSSFYEDHLLFERLYNEVQDGIDSVAEKIIGLKISPQIDAKELSKKTSEIVSKIGDKDSSKEIELLILKNIEAQLESSDMSPGLANLLGDLHDKHESFIYLLNQKTASAKSISKLAQEFLESSLDFSREKAAKQIQQAMSACSQALNSIDIYENEELYKLVREASGYLVGMWRTSNQDIFLLNIESYLPKLKTILAMCIEKSQGPVRSQLMTSLRLVNSIKYQ